MVLQSDDPETLKNLSIVVKGLVQKHSWSIKSEAMAAFEICWQCYLLADRPPADAQRTAAVELLSQLIIRVTE